MFQHFTFSNISAGAIGVAAFFLLGSMPGIAIAYGLGILVGLLFVGIDQS